MNENWFLSRKQRCDYCVLMFLFYLFIRIFWVSFEGKKSCDESKMDEKANRITCNSYEMRMT